MGALSIGSTISIPCKVMPGAFSDERLVSFETLDGVISGFVRQQELKNTGENWYISCIVKQIETDNIIVMVRGSFFTTNGIANISRSLACAA